MVIAFIGLSTIQVYWIQNSITLKESQFSFSVKSALADISNYLERQEVNERMRQSGFDEQFCFQIDSTICFSPGNGRNGNMTVSNDSVILLGNGDIIKYQSQTVNNVESGMQSMTVSAGVSSIFDELSFQRAQFMSDMFMDLFARRDQLPIQYSLDLDNLKPVIDKALKIRGVELNHNIGILSRIGQPLAIQSGMNKTSFDDLMQSNYRMPLFDKGMFNNGYRLHLDFPNERKQLLMGMWPMLLSSGILMLIIIGVFCFTIFTILKQKKISEIKNDFIGNMTHELKTPISTISLACEALSDDGMVTNKGAKDRFVGMIREENHRLGTLVENVLRTAIIDKGELKYDYQQTDILNLLKQACKNVKIRITKKGGALQENYFSESVFMLADQTHMSNVFYNLLDNAIKYSPEQPNIKVDVNQQNDITTISVWDKGLGISKENQSKIFDKLYRVPNGNTHDVKGFGLGLSYLKVIVEQHGGTVSVNSKLGEGSCFTIKLPM